MEMIDNESTVWTSVMYESTASPGETSSEASVFLGILLFLLSIISILGNICTILAFKSNHRLRHKHSNLLILSLSCLDLVIGATGLPSAAVYTGLGIWPLGRYVCVMNALFSVMGVSGGMYTVTAINIDRYLLVSREYPSYLRIQSSRNLKLQIAGAWLLAILIGLSETIIWVAGGTSDAERLIDYTNECRSPVRTDKLFVYATFVLVFALPFLIMIISNLRFVVLLRRRLRKPNRPTPIAPNKGAKSPRQKTVASNTAPQKEIPADPEEKEPMVPDRESEELNSPATTSGTNSSRGNTFVPLTSSVGKHVTSGPLKTKNSSKKMKNRYIKPAIRLAILMSVFAFCSLPYPIFVLIADTKCSHCAVVVARNHLSNLLLSNSALNPFVYAIMHRQIRQFYVNKFNSVFCRRSL